MIGVVSLTWCAESSLAAEVTVATAILATTVAMASGSVELILVVDEAGKSSQYSGGLSRPAESGSVGLNG